jgi:RNA polymerase sigma factor (sigma-70 family)
MKLLFKPFIAILVAAFIAVPAVGGGLVVGKIGPINALIHSYPETTSYKGGQSLPGKNLPVTKEVITKEVIGEFLSGNLSTHPDMFQYLHQMSKKNFRISDEHERNSLVNDTFMKLWNNGQATDIDHSNLPGFVYKTMKNTQLNYLRNENDCLSNLRSHFQNDLSEYWSEDSSLKSENLNINNFSNSITPERQLDGKQQLESVLNESGFSPQESKAYFFRLLGHSVKETADLMGVGTETVKSHLAKANSKIPKSDANSKKAISILFPTE